MNTPPTTGFVNVRRSPRAELSAAAALFVLTVRQHTHGRRLLVLGLIYALPCGLAVVLRSLARPAPPEVLEFALILNLLPQGLAPLTALLYAAGVVRDEVEEQTLTYLLLRSVPRWAIYVIRLLATMVVTTLLVGAATVALYLAVYWGMPDVWGNGLPTRVVRVVGVMAIGQVGYCALFGFLGLFVRRSLVIGIIYIAAVEGVLASLDFVARKLTVAYYVRALILRWLDPAEELLRRWQRQWGMDVATVPPARDCVMTIVLFSLVATLLTATYFARREFCVKTPGEG
jgi:ABC-2 type transport system permease protein